jgi:hypothetical protein
MRIISIKKTRRYKKLKSIVDKIDNFKLDVVKYNEGYNRLDGKKSKIKAGFESDDVIQILNENGETYIDTYISEFNNKELKRMINMILLH